MTPRRRCRGCLLVAGAALAAVAPAPAASQLRPEQETGWRAVEKFAKELRMQDAVVAACERNLYVWETYLNGIAAAGDARG